jgi:hypothetical protein
MTHDPDILKGHIHRIEQENCLNRWLHSAPNDLLKRSQWLPVTFVKQH